MKLITFVAEGQLRWGALNGEMAVDLNLARAMLLASRGLEAKYLANDPLDFLRQGDRALEAAQETLEFFGHRVVDGISFHKDKVTLLAPIGNPSKVVAIGLNYAEHRAEHSGENPGYPILFPKFPSSIIGPEEAITWDQAVTRMVDYEGELGIVIGKRAKRVSVADASSYVFGYCNLDDISARDLQFDDKGGKQWTRGKSLDTFCPIGPYVVSHDEIPDVQNLTIQTWVNGELRQSSNTSNMIANVAQLVSFISQGITLCPGDIIASGTPAGVGHHRTPPAYLKSGDIVEVQVEGLGRLRNPVK